MPLIAQLAEILMREGLLPAGDLPLSVEQAVGLFKQALTGFSAAEPER
jgi:hypothetical protein